ncbi:MAG: O-antigen ligase family protein [Pyrinomonadaceae bacterium]
MPAKKNTSPDYKSLNAAIGDANKRDDLATLKPSDKQKNSISENLINPQKKTTVEILPEEVSKKEKLNGTDIFVSAANATPPENEIEYGERLKRKKKEKKEQKDRDLLGGEQWLRRNGHNLTYVGLYLFSILVFYRPYEMIPSLAFLSTSAFYFALVTLAIYIPTQLSVEGSLTIFSTEVKCILVMAGLALLTMPIAKDPATAWATFNDSFSKAVLMFIVMVNVVRTRRRLVALMWISLSIGIYLSYTAISMYMRGELNAEGYRVDVDVKGLFGNPNDLALHLVTMIPLAVALGFASRHKATRIIYFLLAALLVAANTVTFSRGGFLGLIASSAVLVWKLGRKNRLNISLASIVVGGLFILLAPGNYGVRILSIFGLAPDPVGSSDQRRELLIRSLVVTARNPWGIGIGNFPIVGIRNLVTHNSFTQVSSELGILGLAAYLIFMISPFRKLGAIERTLFAKDELDWFYYLSIGLQASIVGYMVSGFFVAVAYNWFIYYLVAYAVAFRRIYRIERGIKESETDTFGLRAV